MPYRGDAYNIAVHGDNTAKVTDAIEKTVYSLVKLDVQQGAGVERHTSQQRTWLLSAQSSQVRSTPIASV
jgi:hypothetical protein